jgi:hypothetical protein
LNPEKSYSTTRKAIENKHLLFLAAFPNHRKQANIIFGGHRQATENNKGLFWVAIGKATKNKKFLICRDIFQLLKIRNSLFLAAFLAVKNNLIFCDSFYG